MRVLYCALDQVVPGTSGGSTHVLAVAQGLARLGHEVHVLTAQGAPAFPENDGVAWHALSAPGRRPHLRLLRSPAVRRLASRLRPDVVIERYHNFGGEGMLAASETGALGVLEVNAAVIDHPGSGKSTLDAALLVRPMRRWRERLCRMADLLVTPTARILPAWVPRERVVELEWGADTDRFHPRAAGAVPFEKRPGETVAVFAGAFRAWHGAAGLARAATRIEQAGTGRLHAVFVGDGPDLASTRAAAARLTRVTFTGSIPYEAMPACLAASDIGVAPFDTVAHPPLQLDFFWSPLKVFEYMASGLPVVAPRLPRLAGIVEDGREGVLYDDTRGDEALADALTACLGDPARRRDMGAAARARAEADFSWQAHCARLAAAIEQRLARRERRR